MGEFLGVELAFQSGSESGSRTNPGGFSGRDRRNWAGFPNRQGTTLEIGDPGSRSLGAWKVRTSDRMDDIERRAQVIRNTRQRTRLPRRKNGGVLGGWGPRGGSLMVDSQEQGRQTSIDRFCFLFLDAIAYSTASLGSQPWLSLFLGLMFG